jgi:hypothetical protein
MKLSVNAAGTIANFGHVFSDSFKVVGELVQNARRAGATLVSIDVSGERNNATIVVTDNGSGIADFNALFVLSDSGWGEDVQEKDQPFGIGFFSTFYTAKSVTVQSQGKRITIDSAAAIAMEDFGEVVADDISQGTVITLSGVSISDIEDKIRIMADTSSIDIVLNGQKLSRNGSLQMLSTVSPVVDTPFGKLVLRELFSPEFTVVAQDVVVYRSHSRTRGNVLFADTQCVKVRMPDRDSIINVSEFKSAFEAYLKAHYTERLNEIRTTYADDKVFVTKYFKDILLFCSEMLNGIDFLPAEAFRAYPFPTLAQTHYARFEEMVSISKDDDAIILKDDYDLRDGYSAVLGLYLYHKNALIVHYNLPADHWVWSKVKDFGINDFRVTFVNPIRFEYDHGNFLCGGNAVACDDIIITYLPTGDALNAIEEGGSTCFSGFGVGYDYIGDEQDVSHVVDQDGNPFDFSNVSLALLKDHQDYSDVLTQVESYMSEWDFEEMQLEEDVSSLVTQVNTACGDDINKILSRLIGSLPSEVAKRLTGKTGTIRFDDREVIFDVE